MAAGPPTYAAYDIGALLPIIPLNVGSYHREVLAIRFALFSVVVISIVWRALPIVGLSCAGALVLLWLAYAPPLAPPRWVFAVRLGAGNCSAAPTGAVGGAHRQRGDHHLNFCSNGGGHAALGMGLLRLEHAPQQVELRDVRVWLSAPEHPSRRCVRPTRPGQHLHEQDELLVGVRDAAFRGFSHPGGHAAGGGAGNAGVVPLKEGVNSSCNTRKCT